MNRDEILEKQLFTIDGQIIGTALYIVALLIAIILLINLRNRVLDNDPFLNEDESRIIALANKIFIFLIFLWFLYINYKAYEFAEENGQNTKNFELQVIIATISLILAGIAIYIVINEEQSSFSKTAQYENPDL